MVYFLIHMFNISFMTCMKRYIGHKSLEDQTLSRRNGCLTFLFFQICNIYSINEENNSVMYLYIFSFSYFLYKKISGDSIPLTQKERCLKRYPNLSFLRDATFEVSHSAEGHSRRLKQPKLLL